MIPKRIGTVKRALGTRRGLLVLFTAVALMLSGCGGINGSKPPSTVIKIGTTTEVVSYSPLNNTSVTDKWVMNQMYPDLFTLDGKGGRIPHLANDIEVSEDGSVLTLKLNKDFAWSDGVPITADDVKFTFERIRSDKLVGGATIITNYKDSTVVSPEQLDITMKVPSFGWAEDIARSFNVMPKHVFESVPNLAELSIEKKPEYWVSGGSFTLDKIVAGQRYIFAANKHYPLRAPGADAVTGVEFRIYGDINTMLLALQNGDLDIAAPSVPSSAVGPLALHPDIEIIESMNALNFSKLTFNTKVAALNDPVVRRAISGMIDTDPLVRAVLQGHATNVVSPVLPIYTDYQPDVQKFSFTPEVAKKMIADAGYKDLEFKLICDAGNANHAKSAQIIRDSLAKADIKVDLACGERATTIAAAKKGNFDLYLNKINTSNAPGTNLVFQYHPANVSGLNYTFNKDSQATKLIDATVKAANEADYIGSVKTAASYLHEQAYLVPLYVEAINSAFNTKRFTGYLPTGLETNTMINSYSLAQVVPN